MRSKRLVLLLYRGIYLSQSPAKISYNYPKLGQQISITVELLLRMEDKSLNNNVFDHISGYIYYEFQILWNERSCHETNAIHDLVH